jgi:hypothetical protein
MQYIFIPLLHYIIFRFFEYAGVRVLGGIFNKIALEGFYNVEACQSAVTSYFDQFRKTCRPYGFVPVMVMNTEEEAGDERSGVVTPALLEIFTSHVDVRAIIQDLLLAKVTFIPVTI